MTGLLKMPLQPDLPIWLKGNSKRICGNSSSPFGPQNKDIGAASQTLLTGVRFHLRRRLLIIKGVNILLDFVAIPTNRLTNGSRQGSSFPSPLPSYFTLTLSARKIPWGYSVKACSRTGNYLQALKLSFTPTVTIVTLRLWYHEADVLTIVIS